MINLIESNLDLTLGHELPLEELVKNLEFEYAQSEEDLRELQDLIVMYLMLKDVNWEPLIENFFFASLKLIENLFNLTEHFKTNFSNDKKHVFDDQSIKPELLLSNFKNKFNNIIKCYQNLAAQYINQAGKTPKNIFNSYLFHQEEKIREKEIQSKAPKNKTHINKNHCLPFFSKNKVKSFKTDLSPNLTLENASQPNYPHL